MPWNDDLDPASTCYVIASDDSRFIRVVAGPGTGKSFAIQRRIARLLEDGLAPARLLPVTFTNVAAEDLQRELIQVGVPGCENIRGTTLHALGMRILRRHRVLQATGRVARPLNRFEMEPLTYDLSPEFGNKREKRSRIRAYEAAWARLQHEQPGYARDEIDDRFEQRLVDWLKFHEGMLIGEIIPQVYQYLRNNPAAPDRNLFDHILVDEYQDLNRAEQGVIDLLLGEGNLCIVGDDDQSLYSFKFAHPAGIRTFADNHENTSDHEILECRRCPTRVVSIANSLIGHNQDREPRQLTPWPANGTGTAHIVQYSSLAREVIGVADFVQDLIQNQNYQPQDILVLAQRRAIGNPINDALAARGIPSKSYYQEGLLDSEYAQERLAILKLFVNPQDRIALRWLLGTGSQNFRTGAYSRVRTYCEQNRLSPWAAMTQLSSGEIKIPYTAPLVERFKAIEAELKSLEGNESVLDFAEVWLQGVVEGFDPFRDLALDIAPLVLSPEELLESIVDQVSQPELPPDVTEVRIMSLHKSKGLSSPVVIIAGCVEGLLPAAPDPDLTPAENAAALEEQRRLFFVGLTRCKAKPEVRQGGILLLTSSREMNLADAMQSGIRPARVVFGTAIVQTSRFIRELGPAAPAPQRG